MAGGGGEKWLEGFKKCKIKQGSLNNVGIGQKIF